MIKHHATGTNTTLPQLRQRFTGIAQVPDIGRGIRTRWADENAPTDAELRLIGHSYRQDVPRPVNTIPAPDALIDDVWVQQWTPIIDDELRARIRASISPAASDWIDAAFPPRIREKMAGEFQVLQYLGGALWTDEQAARVQYLLGVWAWVESVHVAASNAASALDGIDRAALDAWTMPALPEWGA